MTKLSQDRHGHILGHLTEIGYNHLDPDVISKAVSEGASNPEFVKIFHWISAQMKNLKTNENLGIGIIPDNVTGQSFILEMRSFIEELGCPKCYLDSRFLTNLDEEYWVKVIGFLCSELQAMRIIEMNRKKAAVPTDPKECTANQLKVMLMALGFSKPPPQITSFKLFSKLETKIKDVITSVPPTVLSEPLFNGVLTENQWKTLENLNEVLQYDYFRRRNMLLKRLDVTVQSFTWSDQIKKIEDDVGRAFSMKRKNLTAESKINISDILAAREDLIHYTKMSSAIDRKNTKCAINKFIIGKVPDRGGRPTEQRPPPPEMPKWQPRTEGSRGGRGGANNSRGGKVQGNWSRGGQGRGGYNRGGHGR